jgi:hypothetical protein
VTIIQSGKQGGGLKSRHYGTMLVVGAVGGIVAYLLFHFIIGLIWHVIEIGVVVAVIALIVWFIVKKAIDR